MGDGQRQNIRVSTIGMRDGVRAVPRWGLGLGRIIVRVTTMSSWPYTSTGMGEVARVSTVEVEVQDEHDPSKSEPPSSRGSTALWSSHTSRALGRSVLTQGPCPVISFGALVLKSETSLVRVRRSGSKRVPLPMLLFIFLDLPACVLWNSPTALRVNLFNPSV